MFAQGERIYLRPPEREHIELLLRWFNDPEVTQYVLRYRPLGRAEEEEWLSRANRSPEEVVLLIVAREGDVPIGTCGLHRIGLPNANAELGIVIGESAYWNRGFGREAMNLLCGYGFQRLNLHRIGLSVYEYNRRAIRCYERVGFRPEGRRREARFWNGRFWDILEMGLLAREWRGQNEASGPAGCREPALVQAE